MSTSIEKSDDLVRNGLLIAVRLYDPMLIKERQTWFIDTLAVIDTAAPYTVVREGVATSIGIEPFEAVTLATSRGRVYECYNFIMSLRFPSGYAFELMDIVEVPYMLHPDTRVTCKIGRDILRHAVLTYNGCDNVFRLEFRG
jgi:hypothetical protein